MLRDNRKAPLNQVSATKSLSCGRVLFASDDRSGGRRHSAAKASSEAEVTSDNRHPALQGPMTQLLPPAANADAGPDAREVKRYAEQTSQQESAAPERGCEPDLQKIEQ